MGEGGGGGGGPEAFRRGAAPARFFGKSKPGPQFGLVRRL
jgi:hypothetical protein